MHKENFWKNWKKFFKIKSRFTKKLKQTCRKLEKNLSDFEKICEKI